MSKIEIHLEYKLLLYLNYMYTANVGKLFPPGED